MSRYESFGGVIMEIEDPLTRLDVRNIFGQKKWGVWALRKFNGALLVTQVWHIFHNINYLLYKVFKVKVFL